MHRSTSWSSAWALSSAVRPSRTVVTEEAHPSAIARLLEEISWEGNARRYRDGGRGRENVLTTEVFGALDLLPRTAFLGGVLRAAYGADPARLAIAESVEEADVHVLPGDVAPTWTDATSTRWTVQPDATISSATTLCFVEAKRLRSASFQRSQLARTLLALHHAAAGRTSLLLLVLATAPPVAVARLGRLSIEQAIDIGLEDFPRLDADAVRPLVATSVTWITWDEIAAVTADAVDTLGQLPDSVRSSLVRLSHTVITAIDWHR